MAALLRRWRGSGGRKLTVRRRSRGGRLRAHLLMFSVLSRSRWILSRGGNCMKSGRRMTNPRQIASLSPQSNTPSQRRPLKSRVASAPPRTILVSIRLAPVQCLKGRASRANGRKFPSPSPFPLPESRHDRFPDIPVNTGGCSDAASAGFLLFGASIGISSNNLRSPPLHLKDHLGVVQPLFVFAAGLKLLFLNA